MDQLSFASLDYAAMNKLTKRDVFSGWRRRSRGRRWRL